MHAVTFAVFAILVFLSFTTEAMAGFGSMIIAATLGAHLLPVDHIVTLLVPLNVILAATIVYRHRQHIAARMLLVSVLPLMLLGLGVGQLVFFRLKSRELKMAFGVLVLLVSVRELHRLLSPAKRSGAPSEWVTRLWIFFAGIIHGIFATGGPPLVYALGRSELDKSVLRSTLSTVWLSLNSILTLSFVVNGRLNADSLEEIGILFPVVVLAILVGDRLHHRIDERRFRIAVFSLLAVAGLALLV